MRTEIKKVDTTNAIIQAYDTIEVESMKTGNLVLVIAGHNMKIIKDTKTAFIVEFNGDKLLVHKSDLLGGYDMLHVKHEEQTTTLIDMDIQLLASKPDRGDISPSMKKAINTGWNGIDTSIKAHIANQLQNLNNDKFYMSGNMKTGEIKCFNLPNIRLQQEYLQFIKNNPYILEYDNEEDKETTRQERQLVEYLKTNRMCYNCQGCKTPCYNNKAYIARPDKSICDLRQLMRLIDKPNIVIGEIVQATKNDKYVRLNGSGEIHNKFILDTYIKVAKLNPSTIYYTYTKNYALIAGKRLPKNLIINISIFNNKEIVDKYDFSKNLNKFVVVSSEEYNNTKEDKQIKKCSGTDCINCKLCMSKKGYTILCKIH